MNSVFSAVLTTLLVLVVLWIMIFGTAGWLLAKQRMFSQPAGFLLGVFTGPFGLCFIFWKSRRIRPIQISHLNPAAPISTTTSLPDELSAI